MRYTLHRGEGTPVSVTSMSSGVLSSNTSVRGDSRLSVPSPVRQGMYERDVRVSIPALSTGTPYTTH